MSREWEPGDVALVSDPAYGEMSMMLVGHDPGKRCWHGVKGNGDLRCLDARQDVAARPLVVIDPEDQDQVERLTGALVLSGQGRNDLNYWRETQAALRSLIADPTPDEPTGIGAVVEDGDGLLWVHRGPAYLQSWTMCDRQGIGGSRPWSGIQAVRVLSEGVTP